MVKKIRISLAPSMRAESMISLGTEESAYTRPRKTPEGADRARQDDRPDGVGQVHGVEDQVQRNGQQRDGHEQPGENDHLDGAPARELELRQAVAGSHRQQRAQHPGDVE